jgi:hypothetical protein
MDIHFDYRSYQDLQNIPRLRNFLLKEWIKSSVKRVVKLPESVDSENANRPMRNGYWNAGCPKLKNLRSKLFQ